MNTRFLSKFFSAALAAVMLCSASAPVYSVPADDPVPYGDVNRDGNIDAADAVAVLRHLAGWEDPSFDPVCADVDNDGEVSAVDAVKILKYIAGWGVKLGFASKWDVKYEYECVGTAFRDDTPEALPYAVIVRSAEELKALYMDFARRGKPGAPSYPTYFAEKYDAEYFAEHILIAALFVEGSGMNSHSVEGLVYDDVTGEFSVQINRYMPSPCTGDMGWWYVLIEPETGFGTADSYVTLDINEIRVGEPWEGYYDFHAEYVDASEYIEDAEAYPFVEVIRSKKELDKYLKSYRESDDDVYAKNLLAACEKYDEEYFKFRSLIIVYVSESHGSPCHRVESLRAENGKLIVSIGRTSSDVHTDAAIDRHIIIEPELGVLLYNRDSIVVSMSPVYCDAVKLEEMTDGYTPIGFKTSSLEMKKHYGSPYTLGRPQVEIIRSTFELEQFYLKCRMERAYADDGEEFLKICEKYDDAYFENQVLVFLFLEESSPDITHTVDELYSANGFLLVNVNRYEPETLTGGPTYKQIIIEPEAGENEYHFENLYINGILAGTR